MNKVNIIGRCLSNKERQAALLEDPDSVPRIDVSYRLTIAYNLAIGAFNTVFLAVTDPSMRIVPIYTIDM